MLGYLFYVGDPDATDLPYLREPDGADDVGAGTPRGRR